MPAERRYESNPKHKFPKGYGTLCQRSVTPDHCEQLLTDSVPHPAEESAATRYAICGMAVFRGFGCADGAGVEVWHGFPVPGETVPRHVIETWVEQGRIPPIAARRLQKQRTIPEACGCSA